MTRVCFPGLGYEWGFKIMSLLFKRKWGKRREEKEDSWDGREDYNNPWKTRQKLKRRNTQSLSQQFTRKLRLTHRKFKRCPWWPHSLIMKREYVDREKIICFISWQILFYPISLFWQAGREREKCWISKLWQGRTGNRRHSMSYHSQKAYCAPSHM